MLHLVVGGTGVPLALEVTAGQCHESQYVESVMNAIRIGRHHVVGDKKYSCEPVLRWPRRHKVTPVIPTACNEQPHENFDRESYRGRDVVERCPNWLKVDR